MPIRSVQAHAPAFSITGEPVFPYRSARLPPASLRKSALRGDLPSGSLDRAYTLPGSLSKACPAPSPSLRIPIHYSRIFPFLQGGFANFQGRHQRLCLWTPQGSSSLDPFARLSCAFFHKICACCAGGSRLQARPEGFAVALWTASPPSGSYLAGIATFLVSVPFVLQLTPSTNRTQPQK